eukprot:9479443-Pyramimonas_sp.AAC.1
MLARNGANYGVSLTSCGGVRVQPSSEGRDEVVAIYVSADLVAVGRGNAAERRVSCRGTRPP